MKKLLIFAMLLLSINAAMADEKEPTDRELFEQSMRRETVEGNLSVDVRGELLKWDEERNMERVCTIKSGKCQRVCDKYQLRKGGISMHTGVVKFGFCTEGKDRFYRWKPELSQ